MPSRILEIRRDVLSENDRRARALREEFRRSGVLAVNLVSSPGAGKTSLLVETLRELAAAGTPAAVIAGDVETDNDARRVAAAGHPVRQIETHGACHLDAAMVVRRLDGWDLDSFDYLFIENVGNLVCPAGYDLGEGLRAVILSVTEGEDKPLKYPALFHSADVVLLSKMDLAGPCEFDRAAALRNIEAVRPGAAVIETSARTGAGLEAWLEHLAAARRRFLSEKEAPCV